MNNRPQPRITRSRQRPPVPVMSKPKSNRAGHFGRALCALAGAVGLMAAAPAWSAPITYDFNNGTLQGWHNRVWDISANNGNGGWVDLDPNVTKLPLNINSGALQPASTDDQLFG